METDLIKRIKCAGADELGDALIAFMQRYDEVFPDWSVMLISIEKGRDKNEQLDRMIRNLQAMKELDE